MERQQEDKCAQSDQNSGEINKKGRVFNNVHPQALSDLPKTEKNSPTV